MMHTWWAQLKLTLCGVSQPCLHQPSVNLLSSRALSLYLGSLTILVCQSSHTACVRKYYFLVGLGVALKGLEAKLSDTYGHNGGPMALQFNRPCRWNYNETSDE